MGILHLEEHASCKNYDKRDRPLIGGIELGKNEIWSFFPEEGKIIFVIKGKLKFSFGDFSNREISKGQFFHLPPGFQFASRALEDTSIIVIRMYTQMKLCECFATESLLKEKENDFEFDLEYLNANEILWRYLDTLTVYMNDGFQCIYLLEMKLKEFFFILRAYYSRKDLLQFFYLHLTNDISFSEFIHQNYHKAKTAQELADIANYSLSGLQKRFKKVFGLSVYTWMLDMKAKNILQDINNSNRSFKEISNTYEFSSPAHFSNFCKSQFGATPGQIRKLGIVNIPHYKKKERKD